MSGALGGFGAFARLGVCCVADSREGWVLVAHRVLLLLLDAVFLQEDGEVGVQSLGSASLLWALAHVLLCLAAALSGPLVVLSFDGYRRVHSHLIAFWCNVRAALGEAPRGSTDDLLQVPSHGILSVLRGCRRLRGHLLVLEGRGAAISKHRAVEILRVVEHADFHVADLQAKLVEHVSLLLPLPSLLHEPLDLLDESVLAAAVITARLKRLLRDMSRECSHLIR